MSIRTLVVALSSVVALPVQALERVQVGTESLPTHGVLVSSVAGDVACYLDLIDDDGVRWSQMADFSLCESTEEVEGSRVALQYELGNVLADSCQGNPDCGETQQVALAVGLNVVGAGAAPRPASPTAVHLCGAQEQVAFTCPVGSRTLSVCALAGTPTTLVYRFGKPGHPVEMQLPPAAGGAGHAVEGDTLMFAGGGGAWVRFHNKDHAYVVYTGIGNWAEDGGKQSVAGVVIERRGVRKDVLPCTGAELSELGPDLFEQAGFELGSGDFELPVD